MCEAVRIDPGLSLACIEVTAALGDKRIRQHLRGWHVEMVRVRNKPIEVGVRELLRLDEVMKIRGRVVFHRLQVVRLEDAEHLERCNSWLFGGSSHTRKPLNGTEIGVTHVGWFRFMSSSVMNPWSASSRLTS